MVLKKYILSDSAQLLNDYILPQRKWRKYPQRKERILIKG